MDCCIVVGELRPVIGCCQFFIKMNKRIEVTNVVAFSNKILLKGKNNEDLSAINIGNVTIADDSLSGFSVSDDGSVQFRVRVEPNKIYGCFKNEVLFKDDNRSMYNPQSDNYKPDFEANEAVTFFCRKCSTAFNNEPFKFKRILPLPTSFDTSDFFCHNHHLNNEIKPKAEDCLYGLFFIQINHQSLAEVPSDRVIVCRNCQAWLGIKEKDSIMFWNSSVKINDSNKEDPSIGLRDFISAIKQLIGKDIAINKVILFANLPNNETHFLLIWVVEKNLSLLTNINTNGTTEVLLKEEKVFKILYSYETEETDLLKRWENEMNVTRTQISQQMMIQGLNHLKIMSQNIPEDSREVNKMFLSFIMV